MFDTGGKGKGYDFFADINGKHGYFGLGKPNEAGKIEPFGEGHRLSGVSLIAGAKVKVFEAKGDQAEQVKFMFPVENAKGERALLNIRINGSYIAAKVLAALNGADLSRPIDMGIDKTAAGTDLGGGKKAEKDFVQFSVFQDGKYVKPVYLNADGSTVDRLPDVPKVKVNGQNVANFDGSEFQEAVYTMVKTVIERVDVAAAERKEAAAQHGSAAPDDDDSSVAAEDIAGAVQAAGDRPRAN